MKMTVVAANREAFEDIFREARAIERKSAFFTVRPLGRKPRAGHAPPVARQARAADETVRMVTMADAPRGYFRPTRPTVRSDGKGEGGVTVRQLTPLIGQRQPLSRRTACSAATSRSVAASSLSNRHQPTRRPPRRRTAEPAPIDYRMATPAQAAALRERLIAAGIIGKRAAS
jgi:hypothetical protein